MHCHRVDFIIIYTVHPFSLVEQGPVSIYPKDVFEMVADRNAASSLAESSQRHLLLLETHPRFHKFSHLLGDLPQLYGWCLAMGHHASNRAAAIRDTEASRTGWVSRDIGGQQSGRPGRAEASRTGWVSRDIGGQQSGRPGRAEASRTGCMGLP